MLGLVGIPCYGTILTRVLVKRGGLGLVGIPCYGTIFRISRRERE